MAGKKFPPLGTPNTTERGFKYVEFTDLYGYKCSLQESSLATESAIWLGVDNVEPQIMSSKAAQYGLETDETTGWVPYPIPADVSMHTRMHLTRDQVAGLIARLQSWMKTETF